MSELELPSRKRKRKRPLVAQTQADCLITPITALEDSSERQQQMMTVEGFLRRIDKANPSQNSSRTYKRKKKASHSTYNVNSDYVDEQPPTKVRVKRVKPFTLAQRLFNAAVTSGVTDPCDEITDGTGRRPLQFARVMPATASTTVLRKRRSWRLVDPTHERPFSPTGPARSNSFSSNNKSKGEEIGQSQTLSRKSSRSESIRSVTTWTSQADVSASLVESYPPNPISQPRASEHQNKRQAPKILSAPPLSLVPLSEAEKQYATRMKSIRDSRVSERSCNQQPISQSCVVARPTEVQHRPKAFPSSVNSSASDTVTIPPVGAEPIVDLCLKPSSLLPSSSLKAPPKDIPSQARFIAPLPMPDSNLNTLTTNSASLLTDSNDRPSNTSKVPLTYAFFDDLLKTIPNPPNTKPGSSRRMRPSQHPRKASVSTYAKPVSLLDDSDGKNSELRALLEQDERDSEGFAVVKHKCDELDIPGIRKT